MERAEWLRTVRSAKVERFDTLHAPTYDEHWGELGATHRSYAERLARSAPDGGAVLDAGCGTGRLFPVVVGEGRRVTGVDASTGMLAVARRKHPDVPTEVVPLEELRYDAEFDAAMCVDALENLPPEYWPAALAGLRRAVRPGGAVYLTVELPEDVDLDAAYESATAEGRPVVRGELTDSDGGYHYYPDATEVRRLLREAGLDVVDETSEDGYWHLLCRAGSPAEPARHEGASVRMLVAGLVVAVVAGIGILLVAGSFGVAGVALAAVIEAAFVYGLYRYGPSRTA